MSHQKVWLPHDIDQRFAQERFDSIDCKLFRPPTQKGEEWKETTSPPQKDQPWFWGLSVLANPDSPVFQYWPTLILWFFSINQPWFCGLSVLTNPDSAVFQY